MPDSTDISDLERRITAALDRIRRGIDAIPEPAPAPEISAEDHAALSQRLEEERTANAQLEERVRVLKERQEGRIAALEREVAAERERAGRLDGDLQALRQANAELSDTVAQLRGALEEGLDDPALVNRAILAELEGLKAARAADRTEIEEILAELRPIIEEAS
ncbi:hypothetical protein [Wenxinia marina]|uniref:Uncharacterized protein n=1 Tax=Wenxinia marina DSM 24838 TaxID=1123501 RepID=A0A0D0PEZ0_9RHOB|nr:hypothetical protein [Wenxinia marina]KIQ69956.1 hypothetical protein Wenmar_01526 [Wenxinia marina DSM 24838]GGL62423.1 hypothetical protein GCM10011392_16300 [Wenxinia marina]